MKIYIYQEGSQPGDEDSELYSNRYTAARLIMESKP